MHELTVEEVEQIAFELARKLYTFDEPIPDFKTRYPHRLESCLKTPFQSFSHKALYPAFLKKASVLFYLMVKNHPFVNGNKRIAMTTLFFVLYKQGKWLKADPKELYKFAKRVAGGPAGDRDIWLAYIESFLKEHMVLYEEGRKKEHRKH